MDKLEGRTPDIRREDPFELEATRLGIPRENWEVPTVREMIDAHVSLREAHDKFSRLSLRNLPDQEWAFTETKVEAAKHPPQEGLPPNPDLRESSEVVQLMLAASMEAARGGLKGGPTQASYIQNKLNSALPRYGLAVVNESPPVPGVKLPPTQ